MMEYYYVMFLVFMFFQQDQCEIWGTLFLTGIILHLNANMLSHEQGSILYYNRVFVTSLAAIFLIKFCNSLHSLYQSSVYTLTLVLFLLLEFDVVTGENIIYDSYEDWINGIIVVKFLGLFIPHCHKIQISNSNTTADIKHNSTDC